MVVHKVATIPKMIPVLAISGGNLYRLVTRRIAYKVANQEPTTEKSATPKVNETLRDNPEKMVPKKNPVNR
jgi:hypothetical protein